MSTVADQRRYTRILFASAYDDVPDKQGRITIPPKLREYAGLTRECVVIGLLPLQDARVENEKAIALRCDENTVGSLLDLCAVTREQQMAL